MSIPVYPSGPSADDVRIRVDNLLAEGFGLTPSYDPQWYHSACSWLAARSQEYWLWFVSSFNWDSGQLPLLFMVQSEECDFAVAKSIFLMANAEFFYRNEENWLHPGISWRGKKLNEYVVLREVDHGFSRSKLVPLGQRSRSSISAFAERYKANAPSWAPTIPNSLLIDADVPDRDDPYRFDHLRPIDSTGFEALLG